MINLYVPSKLDADSLFMEHTQKAASSSAVWTANESTFRRSLMVCLELTGLGNQ